MSVRSSARAPPNVSTPKESPLVKGRRLAWAESENAGQASPKHSGIAPPGNRFGWKSKVEATPKDLADIAQFDVIKRVDSHFSSFETAEDALKAKKPGKYETGKVRVLEDQNKRMKMELQTIMSQAKELPALLAPAQADINERLQSAAEQQGQLRTDNDQLRTHLKSSRARVDAGEQQVRELCVEIEATKKAHGIMEQAQEQLTQRAVGAEGQATQLDEDVCALRTEVEGLKLTCSQQAEAAHASETVHVQKAQAACDEAVKKDQTWRTRETALVAEGESAAASASALAEKVSTLEEKLAAAVIARDSLATEKETLGRENAALTEASSGKGEQVERLRTELDEALAALRQKDVDMRESMTSFTQMQRDSTAQLQQERQCVRDRDMQVQELRDTESKLRAEAQTAALEAERRDMELASAKQRATDLQASKEQAETTRDDLATKLNEETAALQQRKTEVQTLTSTLSTAQASLSETQTTLVAKTQQEQALSEARRALEVEFHSYKEHHGTSNTEQVQAISDLKLSIDTLNQKVEKKDTQVHEFQHSTAQQQDSIQALQQKLVEAENTRRLLHNTVQELKGNIRVYCRVRPVLPGMEAALQLSEANKLQLINSGESHSFGYDKVFNQDATQENVFAEMDGLVQSALDGYKVCVFAYGQTGSGKTFTMQGTPDPVNWGLIPRALSKIFEASTAMRKDGWEWSLEASFLEIYNETIRDLLRCGPAAGQVKHEIKHDEAFGSTVSHVERTTVDSMQQIEKLMAKAAKQRSVGVTDMNSQSSRSHSVFMLFLKGTNTEQGLENHGVLNLVDLAGSERLDKSGATGDRLKETQAINKSLSALSMVFGQKSSGTSHVNFRDSKLTYLMQPCLSGHGKTLMLVNVGPEADNSHETLCSLRFAETVSQCDTGGKPKVTQKKLIARPKLSGATDSASSRPQTAGVARPQASGTSRPQTVGAGSTAKRTK